MKNFIISILIGLILIEISKCSIQNEEQIASKIVFMAPKDSNQEIQLNNLNEYLTGSYLQNGWYLEANKKQTFVLYILTHSKNHHNHEQLKNSSNPVENHIYYIYFTLNSNSCSDYLNYTHIPLILTENFDPNRKNKIFKINFTFTLNFESKPYYVCLSKPYNHLIDQNIESISFFHQGTKNVLTISTYYVEWPLSFKLLVYIVLVLLYGIFNGLNLGLMSLSVEELELLVKTSDCPRERKYAKNILPLRKKRNYLLCSILISIALTSSVSILVLDSLVEGLFAGIISTLILCIIGEIIPQAICSKYSLPIGSYTRKFTYFFIYFTCILSYPLSKIVDFVLGKEIPTKYNRDAIKELIKKSKCLKEEQCQIIRGCLDLKNKKVAGIMKRLDKVYMIQENEKLTFENIAAIYNSGYSRIPVYRDSRENIVGWFHVKDMTLIHPDDEIRVEKLLGYFKHHIAYCYNTDNLAEIFDLFRKGKSHMAFVIEKSVFTESNQSHKKCIGILTFHDLIEELIQFDISEEKSDRALGINYLKKIIDNQKRKSMAINKLEEVDRDNHLRLGPKITLQTKFNLLQILTNIKPFKDEFIDKSIIEKLIEKEDNYVCKYLFAPTKGVYDSKNEEDIYLYKYKQQSDSFILLLEGCFMVEVGAERTEFYARQFDHFGEQALLGNCETAEQVLENNLEHTPYVPEFSLKIDLNSQFELNSDKFSNLIFLKIDRTTWLRAVKATNLKRTKSELIIHG